MAECPKYIEVKKIYDCQPLYGSGLNMEGIYIRYR